LILTPLLLLLLLLLLLRLWVCYMAGQACQHGLSYLCANAHIVCSFIACCSRHDSSEF
jgi:hypothetical protein